MDRRITPDMLPETENRPEEKDESLSVAIMELQIKLPGHGLDERSYVWGFPGTETRLERDQLVWECDERYDFSEMAVPLMVVSWYTVFGRKDLPYMFFHIWSLFKVTSGFDLVSSGNWECHKIKALEASGALLPVSSEVRTQKSDTV